MSTKDKESLKVIILCYFVAIVWAVFSFSFITNSTKAQEPKPTLQPLLVYETPAPLMITYEVISTPQPTPTPAPKPYYPLTDKERVYIEQVVHGESGNQSYYGKVLVAQCIYNACIKEDDRPIPTIKKYQYNGWSKQVSDETKEAVSAVFDRGEMGVEDNILWFCTIASSKRAKSFHATQEFVVEVGNHRFYKPWG